MVCPDCREQRHEDCPAVVKDQKTLCDCGHGGMNIPPKRKPANDKRARPARRGVSGAS